MSSCRHAPFTGARLLLSVFATFVAGVLLPAYGMGADATAASSTSTSTSTSDVPKLEEIVVTAQRRAESLQNVPIAVEAISGANALARGVFDTSSLNDVVGSLSVTSLGPQNLIYLRGVGGNLAGPNSETSVATYVDGVYIYAGDQNQFPLNAIDRVEVLKGPQGTLFGRNATGGLIQFITKDPTPDPHAEVSAGYGNYATTTESLYATSGLTDSLAANVAIYAKNQANGWGHALTTGEQIYSENDLDIRTKLLFTPNDRTRITATFSYANQRSTMWNPQDIPGIVGVDGLVPIVGRFNSQSNSPTYFTSVDYFGSLRIDYDLGFARIVSTSAYDKVYPVLVTDADYTALNLVAVPTSNQYAQNAQQEIQLIGNPTPRLTWMAGANFFWAQAGFYPITEEGLALEPLPSVSLFAEQITRAGALFGQTTLTILPDTNLTTGLRYTYESITRPTGTEETGDTLLTTLGHEHTSYSDPTWRLSLDHKFTDVIMAYVSYNRGIKSGGYNLLASALVPSYQPEKLNAYEVGLKTEWLDHRLRFNAASFLYKYSNMQVQEVELGGNETLNAAAATLYGVDTDFAASITSNLTVDGSLSYLHGRYTKYPNAQGYTASPSQGGSFTFDADGRTTLFSPTSSGNIGTTYTLPSVVGDFRGNVTVTYQEKIYTSADNRLQIPGYALLNGSIAWSPRNNSAWEVRLWTKNLTNKLSYNSRDESATGDFQVFAPPRTYGISVTSKY
jgi:iron complex outermembrane recepter protein